MSRTRTIVPVGKIFGRWIVISDSPVSISPSGRVRRMALCKCDCGNQGVVFLASLLNGHSTSCGCTKMEAMRKSVVTHGKSKSRVYSIWKGMMARCYRTSVKYYCNYGGRGITVCKEWKKFENFYRDMGDPPDGMSIDRIDNNGSYRKGNCRWATRKEQSNNTRRTVLISFDGKKQTLIQWAVEKVIEPNTLYCRIRNGWSVERSLTEPTNVK